MFGSISDITGMMKAAKQLQGNMSQLQAELANRRYEADAGGGAVRATVDGKGTLIDIRIEPSAAQDVELLEDLIKAAVGSAVSTAQEAAKGEMAALTGGMNIPGLSDMLGGGQS